MTIEFGDPVYVDELPPASTRGGRASVTPAYEAWLAKIEPGKTAMLPSKDPDGGHSVSRVTQLRKVAGTAFKVETRPIEPGKRYQIYVTIAADEAKPAAK